jgi:hypothetical protein
MDNIFGLAYETDEDTLNSELFTNLHSKRRLTNEAHEHTRSTHTRGTKSAG